MSDKCTIEHADYYCSQDCPGEYPQLAAWKKNAQEAIEFFFYHLKHGGIDRRGWFVIQTARALAPFRAVQEQIVFEPTPSPSEDQRLKDEVIKTASEYAEFYRDRVLKGTGRGRNLLNALDALLSRPENK